MNRLHGVWRKAWLGDLDLAFEINVQDSLKRKKRQNKMRSIVYS